MAVRTTSTLVGGIIELEDDFDISPFIAIANELVTECCSEDDYDATRLEMIERYLSAHLYTNYDPRAKSEKAGDVSVSYQSAVDLGFNTSHYGQHAMLLDTAGGLAALNKRTQDGKTSSVAVTWMGKTADEVTDE